VGAVVCLLGRAYYAVEVQRLRAELMPSFLHHVTVLTLAKELLGRKLNMVLLVYIGGLWLRIRGMAAPRRLQPA
jgi:hypothetical protein